MSISLHYLPFLPSPLLSSFFFFYLLFNFSHNIFLSPLTIFCSFYIGLLFFHLFLQSSFFLPFFLSLYISFILPNFTSSLTMSFFFLFFYTYANNLYNPLLLFHFPHLCLGFTFLLLSLVYPYSSSYSSYSSFSSLFSFSFLF